MFLIVNLLIALSLGVHREQLEQRMKFTFPRPCCRQYRDEFQEMLAASELTFLLRPLEALFLTMVAIGKW